MVLVCDGLLETPPGFGPRDDLFAAGLDSMAIMQLLLAIEDEFGIEIPVASVSRKNFETVAAVTRLVSSRVNGHGVEPIQKCFAATALPTPAVEAPVAKPEVKPLPAAAPLPPAPFGTPPLRHCDYFVLSFHHMSRRTGQGGHKAHSFLVLDRLPDLALLRAALKTATETYPMLNAKIHRPWKIGPPEWRAPARTKVPPLHLYSEDGSPGRLLAEGAAPCADVAGLMDTISNTPMPLPEDDLWEKARFSLIETRDGGATLIFSWSHLMCDGVGAELFLQELQRLACSPAEEPAPAMPPLVKPPTFKERWVRASPIVRRFRTLVMRKFDCLGPRKPTPGRTHFEIHTLTEEQTKRANARCAELGCGVVSTPFHLACAMRAHETIAARRGQKPPSYVCSVPVQTRRKGARGPIFQNHVTMFFGSLTRDELELETAVARLAEQHAQFVKDKLGDSLNDLMHTMRMLPPRLYMEFVSRQMRGPVASFFHSHTGEFAAGLDTFMGARIVNAYHVPGIVTPPGTGIFCNEKNGRLVITLCWHEDALDAEERRLMLESFLASLGAS